MSKLSGFSFLSWCLQKKLDKQNKVGTPTVNVLELRRSVAALLKEKLIPIFGWCKVSAALQLGASFVIFLFYSAPNAFIWWQILTVGKLLFFFICKCSYKVCSLMKVFRSVPTSMQQFWLHNLCFQCRAWRAFSVGFLLCLVFQNLFKDMLLYMKKFSASLHYETLLLS